ncbi:QsdR family transcriptional regulator [Halopseudomonas maritima]|uniref:QsdR family transcriptional regulator n=1 Tax=Halopseudomonas maritima TaxID=2918528 RepID=UPI001EEBDE75|nr:QsdR family transcriptional regulator [Halopseudomonas maritima]UJJ33064.1 hypothetical protein HV822_07935 [Halopseudomonas maritima]
MKKHTPLSKAVLGAATPRRVTPLDALSAARAQWLKGQRININTLAETLGVNRATLFRWVGNRDQLYAEVIWSLALPGYEQAVSQAPGTGADYVCNLFTEIFALFSSATPLHTFLQNDTEYALHILIGKDSLIQQRTTEIVQQALEQQVAGGHLQPAIALPTLAYLLVRLAESFLYCDVLSGRQPDREAALLAVRLLVSNPAAAGD